MSRRHDLKRAFRLLLALCLMISFGAPAPGQEAADSSDAIRDNYVKSEYQIPMRDGVRLFTSVYAPKDQSQKYPILMLRTPYSVRPYGEDEYRTRLGPGPAFSEARYIFVYQDVRGCYRSEGEFVNMRPHVADKSSSGAVDESIDTYDTIQWLLDNVANHNGRVGQWGISYPGFYAAAGMIDAHPALAAVSPQAPIADWWYDDFHHHGAFFLPHAFNFLANFGQPRPIPTTYRAPSFDRGTSDGYQFFLDLGPLQNANPRFFRDRVAFWNKITEHPNYDEFWQSRNILPHLRNVAPAVMTVGGWFDAEDLYGALKIYRTIEENDADAFNILVMGPWAHGGWARSDGEKLGNVHFDAKTAAFFRKNVQFPFFQHFLKDEGQMRLPEAYVFETGRNRWRTFDHWPPEQREAKTLYLGAGSRLSFEAAADVDTASDDEASDDDTADNDTAADDEAAAYDEYISDPNRPVPYVETIARGMTRPYMTDDQRFAARRPDVLVYRTELLEEDVTLCGPLLADLWVSTSGTDSDWIVKLIDVFPDDFADYEDTPPGRHMGGYQMMVRSEVIRGRFRNSHVQPEPFVADEPTRVAWELQDVLHTFGKGHRMMIQIQSTWFPLVDRNPQKYVDNIFEADEEDFIKATERVYRGGERQSKIEVGVLPAGA